MRATERMGTTLSTAVHKEAPIWLAPILGACVAIASLLIGSKRGDITIDSAMASMATFLFGVLLAFTIGRTRERLVTVQNLVTRCDSSLFSIYTLISVFSDADRQHIRELIDRHLTDQIDYRLVDHHLASGSFQELVEAVLALELANKQQENVYKELVAICSNSSEFRSLIEAATGQAMSPMEWCGLLLLLLLILSLLAVVPGGTVLGAIVVGVLGGTLATLMILLRKLDLLRWHERVTIWEPTTRMFRSMGRDPYIPRIVIDSGRYRPTGRVRVVDYPDPYPQRSNKTVTVEYLDAPSSAPSTAGTTNGPLPDADQDGTIAGLSAAVRPQDSPAGHQSP